MDILNSIDSVETYMQDAPGMDEFIQGGGLYQDAVVRNLEIIGEAAGHISEELQEKYQSIPWKHIKSMRNRLTHEYRDINWLLVWETATGEIYELRTQLKELMENEGLQDDKRSV